MKEIQYQKFSLNTHKKNWGINKPNVCQFELTFKCGIHCKHCYTDCYNKPEYLKNELSTKEIKLILDKVYNAGVIWLCFTGGDPLSRKDFLDIYAYAKNKGFIITIFTNGCSMTEEIADYLQQHPPFVIEMTLNAVSKKIYEKISRAKGSFKKAMNGIEMITRRRLPLKIKTQVIKDNLDELVKIKKFVEGLGLNFRPSVFLHARLDNDLGPCALRIKPEEVKGLGKRLGEAEDKLLDDDCRSPDTKPHIPDVKRQKLNTHSQRLFSCAIGGGDGIHIDPYGNLIPCICIREPKINLLKENIEPARKNILDWVRSRVVTTDSKCGDCRIKDACFRCPGKALVEKGNLEAEIEWFCELAKLS